MFSEPFVWLYAWPSIKPPSITLGLLPELLIVPVLFNVIVLFCARYIIPLGRFKLLGVLVEE